MKKPILTFLGLLMVISGFGQSWTNVGNTLQQLILTPDTNFRFYKGPGAALSPYVYILSKPQIISGLNGKLNVGLALLKTDTATMLGNLVHKALTETVTGNKTFTGKSIFAKATFQDTILFNALINATANTDNRIVTYSPGHSNMAGYVVLSTLAIDANVVHKTGTETILGVKTWNDRQNYAGGGSWQSDGIRVNQWARSDVSSPMFIYPSSSAAVQIPLIIAPAINALNNNNNMFRFTDSNNHMLIGVRDSSLFTTNAGVPHGTMTSFSYYQQSGGANDRMAFIYDISTNSGVADYSTILSLKNDGWILKSMGTAKIFTNGEIELGDTTKGVIFKSADGTRYRVTVANGGSFIFTAL